MRRRADRAWRAAAAREQRQLRRLVGEWACAAAWSVEKKKLAQRVANVQMFLDHRAMVQSRRVLVGWHDAAVLEQR